MSLFLNLNILSLVLPIFSKVYYSIKLFYRYIIINWQFYKDESQLPLICYKVIKTRNFLISIFISKVPYFTIIALLFCGLIWRVIFASVISNLRNVSIAMDSFSVFGSVIIFIIVLLLLPILAYPILLLVYLFRVPRLLPHQTAF